METQMIEILETTTFKTIEDKIRFIVDNFVTTEKSYLNSLPENCKTYELYSLALTKNFSVLTQVPDKFINTDLLQTGLRSNFDGIKNIPKKWANIPLSLRFYFDLIAYNPLYLEYVPMSFRTKKLCTLAISTNGAAFKFLPQSLKTPIMAQTALSQCKQEVSTESNSTSTKSSLLTNLANLSNAFMNGTNNTTTDTSGFDVQSFMQMAGPFINSFGSTGKDN